MFRRRKEEETRLVNGLYRVDLQGKTLAALEKGGLPIFYYGDRAKAMHEKGLSGTVAVYREGILARSYHEPWEIQVEMIAEEDAKMQGKDPSWRIIAPPNAATAIEVAQEVNKQHGFNVLPLYTRVGPDGSLFAGYFYPRAGADVYDDWPPDGRHVVLGVLPLAVRA